MSIDWCEDYLIQWCGSKVIVKKVKKSEFGHISDFFLTKTLLFTSYTVLNKSLASF